MSVVFLLNTTRLGTSVHHAGESLDSVTDATLIAQLLAEGGKCAPTTAALVAAAATAASERARGNAVDELDVVLAAEAAEQSSAASASAAAALVSQNAAAASAVAADLSADAAAVSEATIAALLPLPTANGDYKIVVTGGPGAPVYTWTLIV